ncbi:hypothetical protein X771_17785 [Mesorhizobium sp. LSJC277A00]|nr:hypothetical protein X771_17785 [Mesorhizobium sp. LSJC277A00]
MEPRSGVAAEFGNGADVEHGLWRLDHRPELDAVGGKIIVEHVADFEDIARRGDLGQQDAVGLEFRRGQQVIVAPFAGQRVDAHDHFAAAPMLIGNWSAGENAGQFVPRGDLVGGRNGVLEVDDHGIAGQRRDFGQRLVVGGGDVKHRAARAVRFACHGRSMPRVGGGGKRPTGT